MRAAPLMQNLAFHHAPERLPRLTLMSQRNYAHKPRLAVRPPREPFQQPAVISLIRCAGPGITRRDHTRFAAQRIHFKTGIVGKQQTRSKPAVVSRLEPRILFES